MPWVSWQVDVSNAFNTVSRDAMLRQCAKKVPACYNWLRWCYSSPSPLVCGGSVVAHSHTGVHQGDSMGPLGFALGLDEALDKCAGAASEVSWATWYLDDGLLVGSPGSVAHLAGQLDPALRSVGLVLNTRKCVLWGPGARSAEGQPHLPCCLPDGHPLSTTPILPFNGCSGISVLGTPVSLSPDGPAVNDAWGTACADTERLLSRIRKVPDGHSQLTLLRFCADACKVNHLLRATAFESGGVHLASLGEAMRGVLEDILGASLPAEAWRQACLPVRDGGFGVRDPLTTRPAARAAALVGFATKGAARVGVPDWCLRHCAPDTPSLLEALASVLGPAHEPTSLWVSCPSAMLSADPSYASQDWWAGSIASAVRIHLASTGTIRDRVRLLSQEGELANSWITLLPGQDPFMDSDFRSLTRFWLGLPLLSGSPAVPRCPACSDPLDVFGDHLLCCAKNGITHRHHLVRDAWSDVLLRAAIPHAREVVIPPGLGRATPFARDRPADLLLTRWERGRDMAVDVTVCHPAAASCFPLSEERARRHLSHEELLKRTREGPQCGAAAWGFHAAA